MQEQKEIRSSEAIRAVVAREIGRAKEEELLIGIDPESYLGKEIMRVSRKVTELDRALGELTSSVNQLNYSLRKVSKLKKLFRKIFH